MKLLIDRMQREHWICPKPMPWNSLWEMLPEKKRIGNTWFPPPPLILAAWNHSSDLEKKLRFLDHLTWAEKHGMVNEVFAFLESIGPEDWHTA